MVRRLGVVGRILPILYGLVALVVLFGLYLTSRYSYLLFHGLVELFSVAVACGIFMMAWNSRRFLANSTLLFIGVAYLFVGILDLLHTLAYKGMGAFPGYGANLPTQLWIASRYVESLSLLVAPAFLARKLKAKAVFAGYSVAVALLVASIFAGIFPACYVEGQGLTAFKRISEYVIALLLVASAAWFWHRRDAFDRRVLRLLIGSIAITVVSELAFTLYHSVYDVFNLSGHLLKILSFYLIYKAIIETGLERPYNLLFRDLKQSEAALRQRTVALAARNQDLDAFAHTVAHDLKNPLGLVVGYADLLAEDYGVLPAEDRQGHARAIARSAHKMTEIVDEILFLSSVHTLEVETEVLDMAEIVDEVLQTLAPAIEESSAQIVLPPAWPAALGYGPWIEHVWANYVSNACKYGGEPPYVELGATAKGDGASPPTVRFWVRDNGVGLSPEEQEQLFTPFTRLPSLHGRGHGLGLSIAKRIVEKLGGQVGVESAAGHGSVFFFTLPAADGAATGSGS
jgi:signal transduction histidine kinase